MAPQLEPEPPTPSTLNFFSHLSFLPKLWFFTSKKKCTFSPSKFFSSLPNYSFFSHQLKGILNRFLYVIHPLRHSSCPEFLTPAHFQKEETEERRSNRKSYNCWVFFSLIQKKKVIFSKCDFLQFFSLSPGLSLTRSLSLSLSLSLSELAFAKICLNSLKFYHTEVDPMGRKNGKFNMSVWMRDM